MRARIGLLSVIACRVLAVGAAEVVAPGPCLLIFGWALFAAMAVMHARETATPATERAC